MTFYWRPENMKRRAVGRKLCVMLNLVSRLRLSQSFLAVITKFDRGGRVDLRTTQMKDFLMDAVEKFRIEAAAGGPAKVRTSYLDGDFAAKGTEGPGLFAGSASSHLIKILFAARLCRPDLFVAITHLANKASAWQLCHDRALRRLFQYITHHADLGLVGCLDARDKESCVLAMSPDADLAGDLETTKSTSGLWIEMQSADGKRCWLIAWRSKRQGSTASSTCEAETISMATALKSEALPLLGLFGEALGRTVTLECREDNTQCISAAKSGYSAALRHLPRTERIAVGVVSETLERRLPRMAVGSCTRGLRSTEGMSLRSGWRPLCSKQRSNDWVSGDRRSPATKAILAHSQLRSPLASRQLRSFHLLPQLHLRLRQILRHQELLNVELVGRLRPFLILRDFRFQGGSL